MGRSLSGDQQAGGAIDASGSRNRLLGITSAGLFAKPGKCGHVGTGKAIYSARHLRYTSGYRIDWIGPVSGVIVLAKTKKRGSEDFQAVRAATSAETVLGNG